MDIHVDLLAWALPHLSSLGSSVTSSVDAYARIKIDIADESSALF